MAEKNAWLIAILVVLSTIAIFIYGYVALSRLTYPFALEFVESNTFVHIVRVLEQKPLFVPPSFDFIPMIYTPGYYYLTALFAKLTGHILLSMRLVSILASILAFVMLYKLCRLRQVSHSLSYVAVGLFAASYAVTGFWFDVGRVDMLFLALLLATYVLILMPTKQETLVGALSGLLIFLTFVTKQSAILAVPFLLLHLLSKQYYLKAAVFVLVFIGLLALGTIALKVTSNNWFWVYTYQIPSAHPISWKMLTQDFWIEHVFANFSWLIAAVLLACTCLWLLQAKKSVSAQGSFALVFLLPLTLISLTSMSKQWGYVNGLLSVVAGLAVVGMCAYQQLLLAVHKTSNQPLVFKGLSYVATMMVIMQFLVLRYDFRTQIPSQVSLEAGNKLFNLILASKQPVFVPISPDIIYKAHQRIHFHASSFEDMALARQFSPELRRVFEPYWHPLIQLLGSKAIQTVILPNVKWREELFNKAQGYDCGNLVADMPRLIPLTGEKIYSDRICSFHQP